MCMPNTSSADSPASNLSAKTWVPLGAVLSAFTFIIGVGLFIQQRFNDLELELRLSSSEQRAAIDNINRQLGLIQVSLGGSITRAEMKTWLENTSRLNPTLQLAELP